MADRAMTYAFEGIPEDLPRPPMSALRALLAAGVLISARAWQELPLQTRHGIARAGASETIRDTDLEALLKQIPVTHVKFVGKRSDPPIDAVPADLAAALGPSRPLTVPEWRALHALDRHVLASLVKNTRLLSRALNEVLPNKGPGPGIPNVWSGAVARAELRIRHDVLQKVMSSDFQEGQAFVLANVSGRRAARRASELLDQQSDSTVGPVEIDWGLRATDDVVFWQAHVSAWDGTFFPVAALLAASTAAAAMYDMVKGLDPAATIILAGIREEPWQAGRDEQHDAPTGLYAKMKPLAVPAPMVPIGHDTIQMPAASREGSPLLSHGSGPIAQQRLVPVAPSSSPSFDQPALSSPSGQRLAASGQVRASGGSPRAPSKPKWMGPAIVGLIVLANLLVIFAIAVFLAQNRR